MERTREPSDAASRFGVDLLQHSVILLVLGLASAAIAGTALAMAGVFRPVYLAVVVVVLWFLLSVLWGRPRLQHGVQTKIVSIVAVTIVVGFVALAAANSSEHLLVDRDPGIYLNTAKWAADNGSIVVDTQAGVFGDLEGTDFASAGFFSNGGSAKIYPQFPHGFSVVLAIAHWLGGTAAMFKANAFIGGFALLAFYAFARRFLLSWTSVVVTAALATNLVQVHIARDAYSELLTQCFVFGGLAILSYRSPQYSDWRRTFLAGLLIGATVLARLDGVLFVLSFLAYLLVVGIQMNSATGLRVWFRNHWLPGTAGVLATAGLGVADVMFFSPPYAELHREQIILLGVGAIVMAAMSLLFVTFEVRPWFESFLLRHRAALASSATLVVILAAVLFYFVRPYLEQDWLNRDLGIVRLLQAEAGVPIQANRLYSEFSLQWIGWYVGIPALLLGVLGWASALGEIVRGKWVRIEGFVLLFSVVTSLYIWKPQITPDHLWAMRRFLPMAIPGFLILAAWFYQETIREWASRFSQGLFIVVELVFVVALVGPPVLFLQPLVDADTQVGVEDAILSICAAIPADGVVAVTPSRAAHDLPQTVRSFCDVPVVVVEDQVESTVYALAEHLQDSGRSLWVLSDNGTGLGCLDPDKGESFNVTYSAPEKTLFDRPDSSELVQFASHLRRVEVPDLTTEPERSNAVAFDGIDDFGVVLDAPALASDEKFAVEIELSADDRPDGNTSIPISRGEYPGQWWFEFRPDGRLEFFVELEDGYASAGAPTGILDDGRVRTIVGFYDGNSVGIICDGSLIDSQQAVGDIVLSYEPILLGRGFDDVWGTQFFDGTINLFRLHSLEGSLTGIVPPSIDETTVQGTYDARSVKLSEADD